MAIAFLSAQRSKDPRTQVSFVWNFLGLHVILISVCLPTETKTEKFSVIRFK